MFRNVDSKPKHGAALPRTRRQHRPWHADDVATLLVQSLKPAQQRGGFGCSISKLHCVTDDIALSLSLDDHGESVNINKSRKQIRDDNDHDDADIYDVNKKSDPNQPEPVKWQPSRLRKRLTLTDQKQKQSASLSSSSLLNASEPVNAKSTINADTNHPKSFEKVQRLRKRLRLVEQKTSFSSSSLLGSSSPTPSTTDDREPHDFKQQIATSAASQTSSLIPRILLLSTPSASVSPQRPKRKRNEVQLKYEVEDVTNEPFTSLEDIEPLLANQRVILRGDGAVSFFILSSDTARQLDQLQGVRRAENLEQQHDAVSTLNALKNLIKRPSLSVRHRGTWLSSNFVLQQREQFPVFWDHIELSKIQEKFKTTDRKQLCESICRWCEQLVDINTLSAGTAVKKSNRIRTVKEAKEANLSRARLRSRPVPVGESPVRASSSLICNFDDAKEVVFAWVDVGKLLSDENPPTDDVIVSKRRRKNVIKDSAAESDVGLGLLCADFQKINTAVTNAEHQGYWISSLKFLTDFLCCRFDRPKWTVTSGGSARQSCQRTKSEQHTSTRTRTQSKSTSNPRIRLESNSTAK